MEERIKLEIPTWSVIKVILIFLTFYFIFLIRDIISLFFFVLILVAAFSPVINRWEKKMRRSLAVILLFAIIFLSVAIVVYIIVPPVISQIAQLIDRLPSYYSNYEQFKHYVPSLEKYLNSISQSLSSVTGGFVSITASVFGGAITIISALAMTAYLLIDKKAMSELAVSILPAEAKDGIINLIEKIGRKLGSWFRGQMLLGAIVGVLQLIGLLIIGVPYALMLAVFAGATEIIPTIGPILSGLAGVIVALTVDPVKAVLVVVLALVVQQLEGNLIVPKVMQKAVGLSPVIIILALLIGVKLLGFAGTILAVPAAAAISVVAQDWGSVKKLFKD